MPRDREDGPVETQVRELPCALTPAEVAARADEAAFCVSEIERIKDARKLAVGEFKTQLEEVQARLAVLSEQVRSKVERREVECHVFLERNCAEVIRTDTGELVQQRALSQDEMQRRLFSVLGNGRREREEPA